MTTAHKFEVEVWKGTEYFNLWCQKMRTLLLQQRYATALDGTWGTEISAYWRQELDEIA